MTPDRNAIPRRAPGFAIEAIDGELLLHHPERSTVVFLNRTASLVWQLCDGCRSCAEVARILGETFPGEPRRIAADALDTLQRLADERVIAFD